MGLDPRFPKNPHVVLDPDIRWVPGEDVLPTLRGHLIPPLVDRIRREVKAWRDSGYEGASETTRSLLRHWFGTDHAMPGADCATHTFRYFFAQREAVETTVWLYEVKQARDPYALIQFDSSGFVSKGMFSEDWTRYVLKLATGAGKTKVMSLVIAWAYFHRRYEQGSDLSTNFLVVAPNIIVLDRLRTDFDGLRIFHEDPVLPENGYEGRNWRDDFQITLHVQDDVSAVSDTGNIFLTNIHRLDEPGRAPSMDDEDVTDFFLGPRPTGQATSSGLDVGRVVREVPDLVVLNDEAHHIHDPEMAWFKRIEDISNHLRLRGSRLALQVDLTATPKDRNGAIFAQTVCDYPLVEAIRQGVVKTPVLPDEASRGKLRERKSDRFTEQYEDYLHLGYLEWKKVDEALAHSGRKPILFVMTDDTRNCDEVGDWLSSRYPEFRDAVLVIHTKRNGELSEAASGKGREELDALRKASREIDSPDSPYRVVVSVMVLREGWDVQNVVTIVGLRPFSAMSKILPEQTLGRGLRRMFRGSDVQERVSVIGTANFIDFVESIKSEGVDLTYLPMGDQTPPQSPIVVEVDRDNPDKDIEAMDIDVPVLSPRIHREYKNLDEIDPLTLPPGCLAIRQFTEEEQREIVFKDIDDGSVSHTTVLDSAVPATYQSVVGYIVNSIRRDLRLVGGLEIVFGKVKAYIEQRLFERPVSLDDPNVLRNLSEPEAVPRIQAVFRTAINDLTVVDRGTTEVRDRIKLSRARPSVVDCQPFLTPRKSIFNRVVGDSHFELEFASFLDRCGDIVSFAKNAGNTGFKIEYRNADGSIANYVPDFLVKEDQATYWIVETKGREDLDDPLKRERLRQWCEDATARDPGRKYTPLFVREEAWSDAELRTFEELRRAVGRD